LCEVVWDKSQPWILKGRTIWIADAEGVRSVLSDAACIRGEFKLG